MAAVRQCAREMIPDIWTVRMHFCDTSIGPKYRFRRIFDVSMGRTRGANALRADALRARCTTVAGIKTSRSRQVCRIVISSFCSLCALASGGVFVLPL